MIRAYKLVTPRNLWMDLKMPQELIQINVRNPLIRVLLIILLVVAGTWSYFAVRWYLGNTLAEYFNTAQNDLKVAHMAVAMAPRDPLTHWRIAQVSQRVMPLDQQAQAIAEFENAVSLSPYDYRFWMSLGRAYEQAGDVVKAENALRRAVALAPAYSYPHWYLGNLLLRNQRYDEAFAELRIAADADHDLRPQQFNLIWEIYSTDPEALKNAVGQSSSARTSFALYLLSQKRFEDGLRLWNSISGEEKKANLNTAEAIVTNLKNEYRFHDAVRVWNDIAGEKYRAEPGQVFDGGFEHAVGYGPDNIFGWQVKGAPQMQVGVDPNKSYGGGRSLRMSFQVRSNLESINIAQLVAVNPETEYEFECYVSTDKLETGSAPRVQIIDAAGGAELMSTPQAPNGTHNWNRVSYTFKTGATTEAVILKIVRDSCGTEETPVCPIFGSVWYDDFSFKRRN
jgi:tetratricopeptide (TPR) repeat protein